VVTLVADTSVLIDLERGNLLQCALAGPDTIATPDLLYEKELADCNGPELLRQNSLTQLLPDDFLVLTHELTDSANCPSVVR
jgi:hypothetical protein